MKKIESWSKEIYDGILHVIEEKKPTSDYMKGFLAGLCDVEGSYSCSVLRTTSYDGEIRKRIIEYAKAFNFNFVLEERGVRLTGGLSERLRFFAMTYPAIKRKKLGYSEKR